MRDLPGEPFDVVAAVRQQDWDRWAEWLVGEDNALGRTARGRWHWISGAAVARRVSEGSALYVVSRGRLRLRIPLDLGMSEMDARDTAAGLYFRRDCRPPGSPPGDHLSRLRGRHPFLCGCPVAFEPVTLEQDVKSRRGMRSRWWPRDLERPCPDWRGAALGLQEREL